MKYSIKVNEVRAKEGSNIRGAGRHPGRRLSQWFLS